MKMEGQAYPTNYQRSPEEINCLIGAPDENLQRFRTSRRSPNTVNRFTGNSYLRSRIAIAYENDTSDYERVAGYAWALDNVSGANKVVRAAKVGLHLSRIVPAWFTFRDIAVAPDYQNRGVASTLAMLLLETGSSRQPISAFVHTESPDSIETLGRAGFSRPDLDPDHPESEWQIDPSFGPNAEPGKLIRLTTNVGRLRTRLLTNPDAIPALSYAHETMTSPVSTRQVNESGDH